MTNLEPDLCWCLPQTWRPANRPVFGRSRCREQECGVFGQDCATSRTTAGTFRQGHGAATERPVATAASKLAGCCGRRRAARANGFGAGGDGCFFCCVCVVTGACGRARALLWLRHVGQVPRASGDGARKARKPCSRGAGKRGKVAVGGGEQTHRSLKLRARGWEYSRRCMPSPKNR